MYKFFVHNKFNPASQKPIFNLWTLALVSIVPNRIKDFLDPFHLVSYRYLTRFFKFLLWFKLPFPARCLLSHENWVSLVKLPANNSSKSFHGSDFHSRRRISSNCLKIILRLNLNSKMIQKLLFTGKNIYRLDMIAILQTPFHILSSWVGNILMVF